MFNLINLNYFRCHLINFTLNSHEMIGVKLQKGITTS